MCLCFISISTFSIYFFVTLFLFSYIFIYFCGIFIFSPEFFVNLHLFEFIIFNGYVYELINLHLNDSWVPVEVRSIAPFPKFWKLQLAQAVFYFLLTGFLGGTPLNCEILKLLIKLDHKLSYLNLESFIKVSITFSSYELSS